MNPNIDRLPVPNTAPAGMNAQGAEFGAFGPAAETVPSQEVGQTAPPQPPSSMQAVPNNVPTISQANPTVPVASASPVTAPISDVDPEFEQKWVNVAKGIVERTKGDPHQQSQELSKAGEEYRKRLGRRVDPGKE